jgi:NAD(P)-dependent dehydrogenase (short-subunit alcohol dehydrogenase family)
MVNADGGDPAELAGSASAVVLRPDALAGLHAVITGAARGIGAAVALALSAAGAEITALDIEDPESTVAAVLAAGGKATGGILDRQPGCMARPCPSRTRTTLKWTGCSAST